MCTHADGVLNDDANVQRFITRIFNERDKFKAFRDCENRLRMLRRAVKDALGGVVLIVFPVMDIYGTTHTCTMLSFQGICGGKPNGQAFGVGRIADYSIHI